MKYISGFFIYCGTHGFELGVIMVNMKKNLFNHYGIIEDTLL